MAAAVSIGFTAPYEEHKLKISLVIALTAVAMGLRNSVVRTRAPKPGKPELFLRTPFDDREPAFSLNGRWIAYSSNESGRFEVYVRPFPGGAPSGSGKWQISTCGGGHPIWSRNGRELFYETLDNRIMVSTYTAKADSFAADKPRLWSSTQILEAPGFSWNLDLAPDGKRFAVLPRPEATGEQKGSIHVTGTAQLLRRAAAARAGRRQVGTSSMSGFAAGIRDL